MAEKPVFWIIAGTTEGRKLVEKLGSCEVLLYVSLATEYGLTFFEEKENIRLSAGRLDYKEMTEFIREIRPDCVIDTTHPYAQKVTSNISKACHDTKTKYIRILRPPSEKRDFIYVRNTEQAAEYLCQTKGKVFLTCGSKELDKFTVVPQFAERMYVRVLPCVEVLTKCLQLGFKNSHIICMQGPFSKELNMGMFKAAGAEIMVTKDSGKTGGYEEKIEAAVELGIQVIVIGRPEENSEGISFSEALKRLRIDYGLNI